MSKVRISRLQKLILVYLVRESLIAFHGECSSPDKMNEHGAIGVRRRDLLNFLKPYFQKRSANYKTRHASLSRSLVTLWRNKLIDEATDAELVFTLNDMLKEAKKRRFYQLGDHVPDFSDPYIMNWSKALVSKRRYDRILKSLSYRTARPKYYKKHPPLKAFFLTKKGIKKASALLNANPRLRSYLPRFNPDDKPSLKLNFRF